MNTNRILQYLALTAFSCCFAAHLYAAEPAVSVLDSDAVIEQERAWTLGVALGHGRRDNPFVASDDYPVHLVLDLAWYGEGFFFDNGDLGLTIQDSVNTVVNLLGTFNNERNYYPYLGRSNGSMRALSGMLHEQGIGALMDMADMPDRDQWLVDMASTPGVSSVDVHQFESLLSLADNTLPRRQFSWSAGVELLSSHRWGELQAQLLKDVSGRHHGEAALLSYGYPWSDGSSTVALTAGMEWRSTRLVEYYYGVRPDEAFPGRPTYQGGSTINPFLRLSVSHDLTPNWRLMAVAEQEQLGAGIRNSPVINRNVINTLFLGLYYRF